MQFLESEIIELTRTVWETVLSMGIENVAHDDARRDNGETVSACVHISGGWAGSVIITCPKAIANRIASQMFELGPDEVEEDLVHDAVGEVVNMIGGNIKGLVPGPSQLSLPAVAAGMHTRLAVPGSKPITQLSFRTEGESVRVVLTQSQEAASPTTHHHAAHHPSPAEVA